MAALQQTDTRPGPALRWHSYELIAIAAFLSGTVAVFGLSRSNLQLWLIVSVPLLAAAVGAITWRRRIVGRPEERLGRIATVLAIALLLAALTVISRFLPTDP